MTSERQAKANRQNAQEYCTAHACRQGGSGPQRHQARVAGRDSSLIKGESEKRELVHFGKRLRAKLVPVGESIRRSRIASSTAWRLRRLVAVEQSTHSQQHQ